MDLIRRMLRFRDQEVWQGIFRFLSMFHRRRGVVLWEVARSPILRRS